MIFYYAFCLAEIPIGNQGLILYYSSIVYLVVNVDFLSLSEHITLQKLLSFSSDKYHVQCVSLDSPQQKFFHVIYPEI